MVSLRNLLSFVACRLRHAALSGRRSPEGSGLATPRTEGNQWFPSVTSFPFVACRLRHAALSGRRSPEGSCLATPRTEGNQWFPSVTSFPSLRVDCDTLLLAGGARLKARAWPPHV